MECTEAAQVLTIITKGYWSCTFKTRNSAIYFLVLTSQRLLQNVARAERIIEQNKTEIARLESIIHPLGSMP